MIGVTFALVHEGRRGFKRYLEALFLTALFEGTAPKVQVLM